MKQDRRVKYTKAALMESLLSLLREKPLEKITVKELCERADVNRSTFYVYYGSPQDLLDAMLDEFYERIGAEPMDFSTVKEYLIGNCNILWSYRDLMLVISESTTLLLPLLFRLIDIWRDDFMRLMRDQGVDGKSAELAYRYISTGASFTIGTWVIGGGMGCSAEEIAGELEKLILNGLSSNFTDN